MEIKTGEALKRERERLGLTQTAMIAGTNLKLSNYSRIENGKRKIDADDLYDLLQKRQINSISFMKRYFGLQNDIAELLTQKIIENFTSHDLEGAKKTKAEIMQLEDHQNLKYRATLTVAVLDKRIDNIDESLRQKILSALFGNSNWISNRSSLKLFADSMLLFDFNDLVTVMHTFLSRIKYQNNDTDFQELVAGICINYLENCYQNNSKVLVQDALDVVLNMPTKPVMYFYKTLAKYYYYLFTDQKDNVQRLRKVMSTVGFENYIKNLPE